MKSKNTSIPIKHHYVPRFLLREFSSNRRHVWAYDKFKNKSFGVSIEDAAAENHFNTMPEELNLQGEEKVAMELLLAEIDSTCAEILKRTLMNLESWKYVSTKGYENYNINFDSLCELAWFAVHQTIRTKEFRERIAQLNFWSHKASIDFFKQTDDGEKLWSEKPKELNEFYLQMSESAHKFQHFLMMTNSKFISDLQQHCMNKVFSIGVNNTGTPFCIGDHPVVMKSHRGDAEAWGAQGVEVAMPISSKYILVWFCPTLLPRDKYGLPNDHQFDLKVFDIDLEMVHFYNSLAYSRSMQFVYQSVDDISLFEKMAKNSSSEIKNPYRARVSASVFGEEATIPSDYRTKGIVIS